MTIASSAPKMSHPKKRSLLLQLMPLKLPRGVRSSTRQPSLRPQIETMLPSYTRSALDGPLRLPASTFTFTFFFNFRGFCGAIQSLRGAPIKESDTAEEHIILTSDPYSYTSDLSTALVHTHPHFDSSAHTRTTSTRSNGFCVIWVCISPSASSRIS